MIVVLGTAGAGKTALLSEAHRLTAASDMPVRSARGTTFEQGCVLGVVRQLLGPSTARWGRHHRPQ